MNSDNFNSLSIKDLLIKDDKVNNSLFTRDLLIQIFKNNTKRIYKQEYLPYNNNLLCKWYNNICIDLLGYFGENKFNNFNFKNIKLVLLDDNNKPYMNPKSSGYINLKNKGVFTDVVLIELPLFYIQLMLKYHNRYDWSIKYFPDILEILIDIRKESKKNNDVNLSNMVKVFINMTYGIIHNENNLLKLNNDRILELSHKLMTEIDSLGDGVYYIDTDEIYCSKGVVDNVVKILNNWNINFIFQEYKKLELFKKKQYILTNKQNQKKYIGKFKPVVVN